MILVTIIIMTIIYNVKTRLKLNQNKIVVHAHGREGMVRARNSGGTHTREERPGQKSAKPISYD